MIKSYSQRLTPPFSGQMQIVESENARAMTLDANKWEIHFLQNAGFKEAKTGKFTRRRFVRVMTIEHHDLQQIINSGADDKESVDERIYELATFIHTAKLPFPANDIYEYWLLDANNEEPLALIFSCSDEELMANFPSKTEWMALPAAVMPIRYTAEEKSRSEPPVNYRFERLITKRAGLHPKAKWFKRALGDSDHFPPLMVKEEWHEEINQDICNRYIDRQSTRLLMLQSLQTETRKRLETAAKVDALEVERFHKLYPEIVDTKMINSILVEARMRGTVSDQYSDFSPPPQDDLLSY
jgi:hypothetical protein